MSEALIAIAALLALVFSGVHLGFAALVVGFAGFALQRGTNAAVAVSGQQIGELISNPSLVIIPIFVLMGELIRRAGIAEELYDFGNALVGRLRGGLAMSTVIACGAFSAICGSSVATAAAMTKVSMPQMRRYGYHDSLSAGTIAAGGTLGILIPPSVPMIIYCIFAREDIGRMFIAGIVPGLLMMSLFAVAIALWARLRPAHAPVTPAMTWRERLTALRRTRAFCTLFAVVLGSLYFGILTPTEAASVGAGGAFLFAVSRGRMRSWSDYRNAFGHSIEVTAAIFTIGVGALVFSQFINLSGMPFELVRLIEQHDVTPFQLVLSICVICALLGMVFDPISILVLIVPVFLPALEAQQVDTLWFGVLVIILIELGLVTPPVGINVFTVNASWDDLKLGTIFAGVVPFVLAMLVTVALVLGFPVLVTGLPDLMR